MSKSRLSSNPGQGTPENNSKSSKNKKKTKKKVEKWTEISPTTLDPSEANRT